MKVFLSWSGEKSRAVAEALRDWLPRVIQEVDPFMSAEDIAAGARWQNFISQALEGSSFGILCVTRENQQAPWLNFEAGAIAKQVETSRVVPLAIDLKPADVRPPLGLFQAKELSQPGILDVLDSINEQSEHPVPNLAEACDVWWPRLEPKLAEATTAAETQPVRDQRELLDEILNIVRSLAAQAPAPAPEPSWPTWEQTFVARLLAPGLRGRGDIKKLIGIDDLLPETATATISGTSAGQPVVEITSPTVLPQDTIHALTKRVNERGFRLSLDQRAGGFGT